MYFLSNVAGGSKQKHIVNLCLESTFSRAMASPRGWAILGEIFNPQIFQ